MVPVSPEDLAAIQQASKQGAAAGTAEELNRHSSGEHMIVDAQGATTPHDKRPWWRTIVPPFVTASLLGIVFGGAAAWGGVKAIVGSQDRDISEIKATAVALDGRVRIAENNGAALEAGNTAQHAALTDKVAEVKTDTTATKTEVAALKADVADLKRDAKAQAENTDKKIEALGKKMDQVLSKLK